MSDFEVVRSDVEGWDVRRVGEAQALSNYATREEAVDAARREERAEGHSGEPEVHPELHSEVPDAEVDARRTFLGFNIVLVSVFVLIAAIALFVVITGVANGP